VRVVSLLPSATEILFAVGAGEDVVGVTFECNYPPEARNRRIVSTTALPHGLTPREIDNQVRARVAAGEDLYHLDQGALRDLSADLVVTQDLCAVCAIAVDDVEQAMVHLGCSADVLTVDPSRLHEVIDSITTVGRAVGRENEATDLVASLRTRLACVAEAVSGRPRSRVAVLEWPDPPFAAGHWVPDMVDAGGGQCVLGAAGERSVTIEWSNVTEAHPDVIVVAPCGYDLEGAAQLAHELVASERLPAGAPVWAVDADATFVRPGPRVVDGVEALAGILHPEACPARPDVAVLVRPGARPKSHIDSDILDG
jgi:iron complex transport system substrate-binding protein